MFVSLLLTMRRQWECRPAANWDPLPEMSHLEQREGGGGGGDGERHRRRVRVRDPPPASGSMKGGEKCRKKPHKPPLLHGQDLEL